MILFFSSANCAFCLQLSSGCYVIKLRSRDRPRKPIPFCLPSYSRFSGKIVACTIANLSHRRLMCPLYAVHIQRPRFQDKLKPDFSSAPTGKDRQRHSGLAPAHQIGRLSSARKDSSFEDRWAPLWVDFPMFGNTDEDSQPWNSSAPHPYSPRMAELDGQKRLEHARRLLRPSSLG